MTEQTTYLMEKEFKAGTTKDAFLKASKWVANHVLANDLDLNIKYSKYYDGDLKVVKVTVLVPLSTDKIMERHCTVCKEMRKTFLLEERNICAECKLSAYQKRAEQMVKTKQEYAREKIGVDKRGKAIHKKD